MPESARHPRRRPAFPCLGGPDMNALTRMTTSHPIHAEVAGPIVRIGFGSIGRGVLPLLERHIGCDHAKFVVIDPVDTDRKLLDKRQLKFEQVAITRDNYRAVLTPLLTGGPGRGMIINLSVDTSSADLMDFCKDIDAFYIDTVCEPWAGLYPEAARRVRQHLVGRGLLLGGPAAFRARLGHAREAHAGERAPPRFRLRRRDLPDATGRRHARSLVDADRTGAARLPGDA